MSIQALFFDFDGVLADSVEIKTKAFEKLFADYGQKIVSKVAEHHRANGGMTRKKKIKYYYENFINKTISDKYLNNCCDIFSNIVKDDVINAQEIKGSTKFIKRLYKKIPLFINSAMPDNELNEIIKKRSLEKYFKEIKGSSNSKSKNLKIILDKYNFDSSKCIFFGDAVSDYNAAIECNVNFVGILDSNSHLLRINPFIEYYKDFSEIISKKIIN